MAVNQTIISSETIDLSDLFPESDNDTPKSTLFTKDNDIVNLDTKQEDTKKDIENSEDQDEDSNESKDDKTKKQDDNIDNTKKIVSEETINLDSINDDTEEFEEAKSGKKAELIEFFKSKIESGDIVPFEDFDDKISIDDYLKKFSKKDFDELWKSNMDLKKAELIEELPVAFKESLPPELQYAAQYVQDGGTDLKGLFKALAQVEEVKSLDPEKDSREVVKQYLTATNYGTAEEINEQLDEWDDLGVTTKKAQGFKPKLDKMEEDLVKQKLANQTKIKEQQIKQFEFYKDNVVNAVREEELHGVKLDKKTQSAIYSGLTQYEFTNSQGKTCTEFEYLLDKKMWVEPDYQTIAMVEWLLKDREGFMKAISSKEVNKEHEQTVRLLKTEQGKTNHNNSSDSSNTKRKIIQRTSSIFKRS